MNIPEKNHFINDVIDDLKEQILKRVKIMPENWDGHEIRQFIADYYMQHYCYVKLEGSRKKDYKNIIIVNNLL